MRCIDADELKERLKILKAKANNKKYEQGLQDAIDGYFPMIIDDAPTIEAEPIRKNPEEGNPENEAYCFDCIHNEVCRYCPHDGCDFKEKAEPVKHGRWIDHEKLIGIFGTLCDHMVDNGRCDVFCPYADTKDANDECEAWRTIQKFRREGGDSE